MKKITFKVAHQNKGQDIGKLFEEVKSTSSIFKFNNEENLVTVSKVKESEIGFILELMDNYYLVREYTIEEEETDKYTGLKRATSKLLEVASWATEVKSVSEKEISNFIWDCKNEIAWNYADKPAIKFEVGDIILCNMGSHLKGETNGNKYVIVCNISKVNLPYVVPIMINIDKMYESHHYLKIDLKNESTWRPQAYKKAVILLNKGKEINPKRFLKVVGKVKPKALGKIIAELPNAFDFTENYNKLINAENEKTAENIASMIAGNLSVETSKTEEAPKVIKRSSYTETVLVEAIGDSLEKLDPSKTVEEQLEDFFVDIGMTTKEKLMSQAFAIACKLDSITYENILSELNKIYPNLEKGLIKKKLQECFTDWLCNKQPNLAEKRPKLSLMFVLKVFAKKMA